MSTEVAVIDESARKRRRPVPSGNRKCGAQKRSGEGTCQLVAGFATSHVGYGSCKFHAGATRNGILAAEKERLGVATATYGQPIYVDPVDALLGEVYRSAGIVAFLGEQVAEADVDELVDGTSRTRALVGLFQGERAHLAKVSEAAIRAGFDERRVRVAEHQAVLMSRVTIAVLQELGLTQNQIIDARQLIGRKLREVSAAPAVDDAEVVG